jgi:hypothetical protein
MDAAMVAQRAHHNQPPHTGQLCGVCVGIAGVLKMGAAIYFNKSALACWAPMLCFSSAINFLSCFCIFFFTPPLSNLHEQDLKPPLQH